MKKKLPLGVFVIGIVLCFLLIKTQAITTSFNLEDQNIESSIISLSPTSPKLLDLSLTPHEPIEIINDGNFSDYGFLGTGEEIDPYIIEGYNIYTSIENGIYIAHTTKYFLIRDCSVNARDYGIHIGNITDGTAIIINNTCYGNGFGIFLDESSNNSTLIINTCNNNEAGIYLEGSHNSTLTNNNCTNNIGYGIYLAGSSDSTISNNTCNSFREDNIWYYESGIRLEYASGTTLINNTCNNNNEVGIHLYFSDNSTLTNNTCTNNNLYGIEFYRSSDATLTNNTFHNNGLYIYESNVEDYLSYTVENNWVNKKTLGFFTNLGKSIISEPIFGQLFLVNCTETTVCNQELSSASIGLVIYWSKNITLTNNICNNNKEIGIYTYITPNSTLTDNTCNNNKIGIMLDVSRGSTLINNRCINNINYGILVYISSNTILTDNTCKNNNRHGIRLDYFSSSCLITYNLLKENKEYGITLEAYCNDNIIHHNTFVDNNLGGTSQALDKYSPNENNIWYDTVTNEGNYWSDWSGEGSYSIDGQAFSVDPYPLGDPSFAEFTNGFNLLILVFVLSLAIIPVSLITRERLKDR